MLREFEKKIIDERGNEFVVTIQDKLNEYLIKRDLEREKDIVFLKEKLIENINIIGVYVDKLRSIDERLNRLENR